MIARNVLIGSSKSIRFTLNPNERVDCGFIEYSTSALEISGAGATGTVAEKKPKKINLYDEVTIGSSTNPIRFTSGWSGFSGVKKDEANNRAEISNDTNDYKELMIVGNTSRGTVWPTNTNHLQRRVGVWDRLDVHGELDVHGLLFQHAPMIEKNSQTDWTKNDHPLQVYFKEKLAGQPRGTMLCVMAAQWDGFPHFWIGCVTGDNKKWITYLKCPDGGGARLLE
jgi:hypothetical protein